GKMAFTSDSGNHATIWNLETGESQAQLQSWSRQLIFSSARFSDDGNLLVTGTPSSQVSVWNTHDGQRISRYDAEPLKDAR
ncbi:hypothetical protein AB4501_24605, partial [Vibrio sp. 10N.222.55.E8]